MASLLAYLSSGQSILLLAFGFGFVIFWHELGHFLAAKWADVKVEQFAVGFGQAMISWRKGLGFRWGSTQDDYQKRLKHHIVSTMTDPNQTELMSPTEAQLSAAAADLKISETEYRLNWIPLGGYVKMLGQDDLKPGQTVSDPRSYNNKTISQRMVIVSAGVIMNVILAAIGFIYIFTVGFQVTQPIAGVVVPGSPAQHTYKMVAGTKVITPLQVGDKILALNGKPQSDFDKIKLNTMLLIPGETVPLDVRHMDQTTDRLYVTPEKAGQGSDFPAIGMGEYMSLKGPPVDATVVPTKGARELPEGSIIGPGDVITAVEGQPVGLGDAQTPGDYYKLDAAMQKAAGHPINITVSNPKTGSRSEILSPHFVDHFGDEPISFAGMQMLAVIDLIQGDSPLIDAFRPGDVIVNVADPSPSGGHTAFPTRDKVISLFNDAGEKQTDLVITVRRNGKDLPPTKAKPSVKLQTGKFGFGISLALDDTDPVVASDLLDATPARDAKVQGGSKILSINGLPVHSWFDVRNIMGDLKPDQQLTMLTLQDDGSKKEYTLHPLTDAQLADVRSNTLRSYAVGALMPDEYPRKGANLWQSAEMGVGETRDAILQVYQTVRSMSKGSIPFKEVSGPVGILTAGYIVAERGFTHLVWFLSIISANLAVMNFLPIPIVDGGLFTFLIIEKIKGSPISQRTQAIAQAVGLALLLSVFLFATYQDVFTRLPILFR